jgi:phospholipid transport system substrate-binding protein
MVIDRRGLLKRTAEITMGAVLVILAPSVAPALSRDDAADFVRATIKEVAALLEAPGDSAARAAKLREIMERRGAMSEIARFVAGPAWRGMDEAQQGRFVDSFTDYVSAVYARRFEEYSGEARTDELFTMGAVTDAGRKGVLVRTSIIRVGEAPIAVDWLVTDRPGRIVISDIVIEGVSLLVTQREEIGAMLEARGGDVDRLIADLAAA